MENTEKYLKNFDEKAALLKVIAHPIRLQILDFLREGPSCAGSANEAIGISQPNLSQHLKVLKDAGLVDCRVDGQRRCYYIIRPSLVRVLLDLLDGDHPLRPCDKIRDTG